MSRSALRKEKWTLSFDPTLKDLITKTARRKRVYPVTLLEDIVRARFNLYGHTDITDSVEYVRELRKKSRKRTDKAFLAEIRAWQKSRSS